MPFFAHPTFRLKVVVVCAFSSIIASCIVLVGWFFDLVIFRTLIPGFPEMKPNAALAFILAGVGLCCAACPKRGNVMRNGSIICGSLVYLIGAITFGEYLTGKSIGSATFIVPFSGENAMDAFSGHMSPHSAFNFTLLGISLVLVNGRGILPKASEFLALFVSIATFGTILGFLYRAEHIFGVSGSNSMAVPTIGLFVLLALGLLAANTGSDSMKLLSSDSLGGSAARRLLPAAILIPTIVGWLRILGQDLGLYDAGFGTALSIFSCVVLMCSMVFFFSAAVHKADRRRLSIEQDLAENEQRYHNLFDYSQGMICIHDLDGFFITVNPATLATLGYKIDEMVGRNLSEFLTPERRPQFDAYLREVTNDGIANGYLAVSTKSGNEVVWRYHNILVSEPDKDPYVLGHAQDVTELLDAQKELKNLSLTDELTGLYNRRGFLTMADQQIKLERHDRTARGLTLMFADMDGLKQINDKYGHAAGSEAIVELAEIINSSLRAADLVARWGGDEFVILTIGTNDENAEMMSERIYRKINEYNARTTKPYKLACSIGVSLFPIDGPKSIESIIEEADRSMYVEKQRRKAAHSHDVTGPVAATGYYSETPDSSTINQKLIA